MQGFALACGFLFVSLYKGFLTGLNSLLFGSIIGVTDDQVVTLLVAPAATATRLTARPALGLVLSIIIGVLVVWAGEAAAFFSPYPIGFWVTTFAFGLFLLATVYRVMSDAYGRRLIGRGYAEAVPA